MNKNTSSTNKMQPACSNNPPVPIRTQPHQGAEPGVTMSSLELVAFINEFRKGQAAEAGQPFPSKGFAKLQHRSFIAKVPEVLGERGAQNFLHTHRHPQNGQEYPCYRFPKREACLMAMSYSYELQAAVYDRMTILEQQQQPQPKLSQRSQDINNRQLSRLYSKLANNPLYPPERKAFFVAKGISILSNEPVETYLPATIDNRHNWQPPHRISQAIWRKH